MIGDDQPTLRAFAIRPAGEDIAQMNVSHKLNSRITLSSYAAKGTYDTGHDFNELGTDINYKTDRITVNIGIGNLREYQQFLGTESKGAYALDDALVSRNFLIFISAIDCIKTADSRSSRNMRFTKPKLICAISNLLEIQDLQADHSAIGITGTGIISKDDNLTHQF